MPDAGLGYRYIYGSRTISSAGRAPPRQGGGRWFEPSIVHSQFAGIKRFPAVARNLLASNVRPPLGRDRFPGLADEIRSGLLLNVAELPNHPGVVLGKRRDGVPGLVGDVDQILP
jgi:hypothetical protein